MTSPASRAAWLPATIARVAAPPPRGSAHAPRHAASEASGTMELLAAERSGPGRHAEPEWSRKDFDAQRDGDPFEWLGFTA